MGAFDTLHKLDWKQSSSQISVGDTVYIYVSAPIQAVLYKCAVKKVNLPECKIDDSAFVVSGEVFQNYKRYMELEEVKKYAPNQITMDKLRLYGMKGRIQSQRRIPPLVQQYIDSIE